MISDHVLRAPLRVNETPTVVIVPAGKTKLVFYSDKTVYARNGEVTAEVPNGTASNDGTASLPYPAGVHHEADVASGERLTFVAQVEEESFIHLAFS